ncbi:MAG TPA: SCO family protein [Chitinophagaceae bacterium]|jgi:protein SCO1/2|nr:SCO family protein [Chitinophagaceae bacterium]
MRKKRLIGYSIFFFVLVMLFLIVVLGDVKSPADFFKGETYATLAGNFKSKAPVLSTVKPFTFTTEDGKPFTDKDMLGKVCVVNYFFTTCKGICPRMNGNMKTMIYDEFKNEPDFMIVSHTCDPEIDSAGVLKKYAEKMGVDVNKWVFLTGRKDSLYQQARNSYLLDDPKNNVVNINDQFLHTQFFALVDKNGNVRGQIYDGLKIEELKQLQKDIRALLQEKATGNVAAN